MGQAEVRKVRYKMGKLERKNTLVAYSFLAPNFLGFAIFTLVPVVCAILLSLFEWNGGDLSKLKFVGLENYANIFDATIQSWMKKHDMYTDVIVRIAYKLKDDDEIKIRNEVLEFNGNECIFEWTHKWIPENLEFFYVTGIIDPDDIEKYTTVYTNPDDTSYREMIRNVSAPTDPIGGVYRRLDSTLKKFATENGCMGEELIVLWTHVEDGQHVLRKDVFHLY